MFFFYRANVQNVAILLTDGQTNRRRADLETEADLLKNGGNTARFETGSGKMLWLLLYKILLWCRVLALGITNAVNVDELNLIASTPNDVFLVANFTDLTRVLSTFINSTCAPVTGTSSRTSPRAPARFPIVCSYLLNAPCPATFLSTTFARFHRGVR